MTLTAEEQRLDEDRRRVRDWKRFGPYLSERQWGTVREDYSANGDAWRYLSHEQARSRAYRWGEDGLLGLCDRQGRLCFAPALWNGADPILKERLFGVTGPEGNHGEDVKELYYYLDATPTHSYGRALYRYPQRAFPYEQLVAENQRRTRDEREFEITDTGAFDEGRYFDVTVEHAKAAPTICAWPCRSPTVARRRRRWWCCRRSGSATPGAGGAKARATCRPSGAPGWRRSARRRSTSPTRRWGAFVSPSSPWATRSPS